MSKRLVNIIKNGTSYILGDITAAEVDGKVTALKNELEPQITANTENIETVSAATTANTQNIITISGNVETISGKVETLSAKKLFKIVESLPTEDIDENIIYVVPSTTVGEQNIYVEYIYANGAWEKVGEHKLDTDLSNYYNKGEVDGLLSELDKAIPYTQAQYDALATKDPHTLYLIYTETTD